MQFNEFYFTEMLVVGQPANEKYVVAFDKFIWIFDNDMINLEYVENITDRLGLSNREIDASDDAYTLIQSIQEKRPDVLIGQIQKKSLYLYDNGGSFKTDPKSSVLVKKVVNQLKLTSVISDDDDNVSNKLTKKNIRGEIPNIGYHGTSSQYLSSILSVGLKSGESGSNYASAGVIHDDLVFFATRIYEAMGHALHTTRIKNKSRIHSYPIIIEFVIPDKDQIIPDYDLEKMTTKDIYYGNTGKRSEWGEKAYQDDPHKLSKHFGIYGYRKRIPAAFIKNVWVSFKELDEIYSMQDFKKMKPKTALKMLDYY